MEENKTIDSIPKQKNWINRHPWLTFGGLIVLLAIIGSWTNQSQPQSTSTPQTTAPTNTPPVTVCSNFQNSQAKKISFADLNKDPDSFNGTDAEFTGQIVQIKESDGQGMIRLDVTKEDYGWSGSDIIYITYTGHNNFVENDVVTVYGVLQGSSTYTSQANYEITLPSMIACSIEKPIVQKVSQTSVSTNTSTNNTITPAIVTTPTPPLVPAVPKTWHTVDTVSTSTTEQTPPFTIQGSEWQVTWNCTGNPTVTPEIQAYSTIDSSIYDTVAYPDTCPSSDTTYLYDGPGTFYFKIGVYSASSISATVEDYY